MSLLRRSWERCRAFFRKAELDADLEAEIASHLEMGIEENRSRGFSDAEARRLALVRMGGLEQTKDQHREARGLMKLDIFLQDAKYTFRTLGRDPGFTIVAVLILALGIGANVAVFSVVNTLLLRPLPFQDAQQLVWIEPPPTKCGLSCATYSTDAYDAFRTHTHSFQDVTGYFAFSGTDNLSLNLGDQPIPATSIDVVANFFQVLGVQPAMGRAFTAADGLDNAPPVVLLTDAWWRTRFSADPNIVGKTFDMNGKQATVIGVLPRTFDFGGVFSPGVKVDAITPLNLYGPPRNWGNILTFIGRLKPGVTVAQSVDDAQTASKVMCLNLKYPETCGNYKGFVVPVPLKDYIGGKLRRSLVVLWCAVGAILLIACVNLSNLMLARAAARGKEFAMRSALGASRARIVGQLLTESLILSGAGALLGLGLASILVAWLAHQGALALPLLSTLHLDGAALAWTVFIAVFAAVVFGLVPGLRIAGGNLQEALKDSGPGSGQGRKHERIRSVLVVTEVALACILLVGAGLLLRSFMKVLDVDLGFQPDRAAAVKVDIPSTGSAPDPDGRRRAIVYQQILSRVRALPGVEAAGMVDYLPLGQNRAWGTPVPKGKTRADYKGITGPLVYVVTPGYLRAMGTALSGRDFTWGDGPKTDQVVVINESMAHFFWPNQNAIGQVLSIGKQDLHVIGVAQDVREESVDGAEGWQIYYPMTQQSPTGAELVVRSQRDPALLAASVMKVLRELNPKQSAAEFRPIKSLVSHAVSPRRFFVLLVGSFAGLGLLLAALGIYGVISYSVTRQTQEIGIRMALGASTGRVQRQVLSGTLRLAFIGVMAGTAISLAVGKLIASLLFATSPWDAATYAAMAAALLAVAAASGYVPARRASRISPMVALRAD